MAGGYSVEIEGLKEVLAPLDRRDEIVGEELIRAMQTATVAVQNEARPLAPVHQGLLRNSIASEIIREGPGSIVGKVGSTLKAEEYPAVMEFGRKPGSRPPPSEALERWVQLVLHVPPADVAWTAVNVARAIGRKGIKGRQYLMGGFEKAKGTIENAFERAAEAIAR